MSNDMNRPAARPASINHSAGADRPTGTYPTGRPAHPSHIAPFAGWRDRTPTEELPLAAPSQQAEQPPSVQDMGRPGLLSRPSMRWHPSLMQLAIGAALVAALLGACNVAAINAHRQARAYCHALVVSDWNQAQRECRGTGSGTPVPEQVPDASPAMSGQTPDARSGIQSDWVTHDSGAPYSKDDPSASPISLPRCTTSPTTPTPCLAHISADSKHAVVLEEDASLTGLDRQ